MLKNKGTAVIIDGEVVAWFKDFNDEASDWCTENYYGKWLTWPAKTPRIIPPNKKKLREAQKKGEELAAFFNACKAQDCITEIDE